MIVATVDEGLRRRSKNHLFDEKSSTDSSPDLLKAAHRACIEETGLDISLFPKAKLKLLSVGMVKSQLHYGALFHLDLNITKEQYDVACLISPDSRLEFDNSLLVRFDKDHIIQFFLNQVNNISIASYLLPLTFYALGMSITKKKKVFLSHNSKDKQFVRQLAKKLEKEGFSVWLDEAEIQFGESLIGKISNAIYEEVDCLLAIISANSIQSNWVQQELDWAMHNEINSKKLYVIPVKIDDAKMPNSLNNKLYVDFTERNISKSMYDKLFMLIRTL